MIVTYNAGHLVEECLRSVTGPNAPSVSHEVIALDNASQPSLVPLLQRFLPAHRVVGVPKNIGFGRACNLGAERARGRYVLLLNPDAVAEPGAIDAMVRAADGESRCGVLGGQTVDRDGRIDPKSCWGAPTVWSQFCFATGLSSVFRRNRFFDPESLGKWDRTSMRDVPIVTGCLMMLPRELWLALGGFDPDYFMYGEDADLCRRVSQLGRRIWITPDAVAMHEVGASSSDSAAKTVLLLKGKMTYLRKNMRPAEAAAARRLLMGGVALRALGARLRGRRDSGWIGAWSRRSQWAKGYATYDPSRPDAQ
ncbi:glycosyltransferase [Nocardioides sp. YIM 123512]|uniref:Glycosyltransferase n=1 Tax=Nocardioides flavescens TaxID=2691959 RepID=A0A6L7ETC4_9ACTN|nr:glycosyltransferase [Nocardioides flavescens]